MLDFWQAKSAMPTPLVFYIHPGGFRRGDKSQLAKSLEMERLLKSGISLVSINYRFLTSAEDADVEVPIKWPLTDASRALQVVRSMKVTLWENLTILLLLTLHWPLASVVQVAEPDAPSLQLPVTVAPETGLSFTS